MGKVDHGDLPERAAEVVESCEVYWVLSGLPRRKINEMKLEVQQDLRDALAGGKTIEAVVGADVNLFAAARMREVDVSKTLRECLLEWSFILSLAALMVLPWQHLAFRAAVFPVYWGTLACIGVIALATKVLLRPGLLSGILCRGRQRWRGIAVSGTVWVAAMAVFVLLASQTLSGRQPVLFYWPWPATVVQLLVTGVVAWIAIRRDRTRPLPAEDEDRCMPEAASSAAGKIRRIWVKAGPFVLLLGIMFSLHLIGSSVREGPAIETNLEVLLLTVFFWLVVIPANLVWAEEDAFREMTWGALPFISWLLIFLLAGVLPPGEKEMILKTLMVLIVLLLAAGACRFYQKQKRFMFWLYLVLAAVYGIGLCFGWSKMAPFW